MELGALRLRSVLKENENNTIRFEIFFSDSPEKFELVFEKNANETTRCIKRKREKHKDNFEAQRRFLELISAVVYMVDNKFGNYQFLPKFENEVRELLNEYKIVPVGITQ